MKLDYHAHGFDLYAKPVECTCLDPRWSDSPEIAHLFKRKIKLTGYNDANFFENVHKEPRHGACECGRKFSYQWKLDGVDFEWKD